jgi:hypothetical protein
VLYKHHSLKRETIMHHIEALQPLTRICPIPE